MDQVLMRFVDPWFSNQGLSNALAPKGIRNMGSSGRTMRRVSAARAIVPRKTVKPLSGILKTDRTPFKPSMIPPTSIDHQRFGSCSWGTGMPPNMMRKILQPIASNRQLRAFSSEFGQIAAVEPHRPSPPIWVNQPQLLAGGRAQCTPG